MQKKEISELSEVYNIAIEHIKGHNNRNKIETIQNKTQEKLWKKMHRALGQHQAD